MERYDSLSLQGDGEIGLFVFLDEQHMQGATPTTPLQHRMKRQVGRKTGPSLDFVGLACDQGGPILDTRLSGECGFTFLRKWHLIVMRHESTVRSR